jgi:hypothetical protein
MTLIEQDFSAIDITLEVGAAEELDESLLLESLRQPVRLIAAANKIETLRAEQNVP